MNSSSIFAKLPYTFQIIWEGNGFTEVFVETLNNSETRPILNLSSISDKVEFQYLGLFNNSVSSLIKMKSLLLKPLTVLAGYASIL